METKELFICSECEDFDTLTYESAMEPPIKQCSTCHTRNWAKPLFLDKSGEEKTLGEVV